MLLWPSTYVAIRAAGPAFAPGALALLRLGIGAVILGVVVVIRREPWPSGRDLARIIASGAMLFGLYSIAVNIGEQGVDAGTAALLINVGPVLIAVGGGWLLREGFPRRLVIGLLVAFAGAAVVGISSSAGSSASTAGVLWCLAAAVGWAVGVVLQKPVLERVSGLQVTFLACATGAAMCLPWAGDLISDLHRAPAQPIWLGLYIGVFPTAVAYSTWAYALRHTSAGRLAVVTYVMPAVTIALSWLFLREVPAALALAGGVLCIAGVLIAQLRTQQATTSGLPQPR